MTNPEKFREQIMQIAAELGVQVKEVPPGEPVDLNGYPEMKFTHTPSTQIGDATDFMAELYQRIGRMAATKKYNVHDHYDVQQVLSLVYLLTYKPHEMSSDVRKQLRDIMEKIDVAFYS